MNNGVTNLDAERAHLARAEAEFAELKAALARGDLITVDEFHALVTEALEHVKARLLAVPAVAAPLVIAAPAEAEAIIRSAVSSALEELADEADAAMSDGGPINDPGGPNAA